jgi:hypothetical protein
VDQNDDMNPTGTISDVNGTGVGAPSGEKQKPSEAAGNSLPPTVTASDISSVTPMAAPIEVCPTPPGDAPALEDDVMEMVLNGEDAAAEAACRHKELAGIQAVVEQEEQKGPADDPAEKDPFHGMSAEELAEMYEDPDANDPESDEDNV